MSETLFASEGTEIGLEARLRIPTADEMHQAAVEATTEVFQELMLPAARAGSPVGTPPDDKHPGRNRDSIAVHVFDDSDQGKVTGTLFTQSGYGWLIEHGTSHNRALTSIRLSKRGGRVATSDRTPGVPYIYPAVLRYVQEIVNRWRAKLEALT